MKTKEDIIANLQTTHDDAKERVKEIVEEQIKLRKQWVKSDRQFLVSSNALLGRSDELTKLDVRAEYYRGIIDITRHFIAIIH